MKPQNQPTNKPTKQQQKNIKPTKQQIKPSLWMKATFGIITFSPSPQLWHITEIMDGAAGIEWTPGNPSYKVRCSKKDVTEIWDIHRWAARKLKVAELFLDEDRDKNRGMKRAMEAQKFVTGMWGGNSYSLLPTLGNNGFEMNQAPHLRVKLNYGKEYCDYERYICSQKAAE